MLRVLFVLAFVSACAEARPVVREPAPSHAALRPAAAAAASVPDAPKTHGARLAPPFGAVAGVRRVGAPRADEAHVAETSDERPTVALATERD